MDRARLNDASMCCILSSFPSLICQYRSTRTSAKVSYFGKKNVDSFLLCFLDFTSKIDTGFEMYSSPEKKVTLLENQF